MSTSEDGSESLAATSEPAEVSNDVTGPVYRRVVFIGKTGVGKSSCANALLGDNENKTFPVDGGPQPCTEFVTSRKRRINGNLYEAIDTIGLGETVLGSGDVTKRLQKVWKYAREGVHHIFFVTSGRMTTLEADYWHLLKILFDDHVMDHTTIIRTHFPRQAPKATERRREDARRMKDGGIARDMVEEIGEGKILYLDVPCEAVYETETLWLENRKFTQAELILYLEKCRTPYTADFSESRYLAMRRTTTYRALEEEFGRMRVASPTDVAETLRLKVSLLESENQRLVEQRKNDEKIAAVNASLQEQQRQIEYLKGRLDAETQERVDQLAKGRGCTIQ